MEAYVYARPAWRCRGVGSKLARAVDDEALVDGRATFSNEAMLAINTALGFSVTEVRTESQGTVAEIHDRLRAERRRG
jgi:GNAT superfamily N-acetyltransferase